MIMMMMIMMVVMALLLESRSPAQVYHSVLAPAHHREKLWFGRMTVNKWEDRLYLDVLLALRWKKVFDKVPHISCGGGAINQVKWKPSRQIMLRRRGSFLLLAFWHIYALYHAERVILRLVWWSQSENCRLEPTFVNVQLLDPGMILAEYWCQSEYFQNDIASALFLAYSSSFFKNV